MFELLRGIYSTIEVLHVSSAVLGNVRDAEASWNHGVDSPTRIVKDSSTRDAQK